MSRVKQITVSTNEIYQLVSFKAGVLNRSSKGAMTDSFWRAPCSLFIVQVSKTKLFKQAAVTTNKFCH